MITDNERLKFLAEYVEILYVWQTYGMLALYDFKAYDDLRFSINQIM